MTAYRTETDLIGARDVPKNAYYGIETLRALENFQLTGLHIQRYPLFIQSFAKIKKIATLSNHTLGLLPKDKCDSIVIACDMLIAGQHLDQFLLDPIQGGAGTSMNMLVNEVLANLALEHMGKNLGDYVSLSPHDDVNMSQSTNDAYPSALKLAIFASFSLLFVPLQSLITAFEHKAKVYDGALRMGRTQLQDALPITVAQTFLAYAHMLQDSLQRLSDARRPLLGLTMGATAIGTGVNAHPLYGETFIKHAKAVLGEDFTSAPDLIAGTQDASGFAHVSGALRSFATQLSKIASDLRLLSSGPRAGLGDFTLPAMQAGSSIMPGKINPVIPEAVNQVCFQVIGHDLTVTLCAEHGQLELNAFLPLIAHNILSSIQMLANALSMLQTRCVDDLIVHVDHCHGQAMSSSGLATFLNPILGYKTATVVAKRALAEGKTVRAVVLELGLLDEKTLDSLLRPENLTESQVHE